MSFVPSQALSPEAQAALASANCNAAIVALPHPTTDASRLAIARCHIKLNTPAAALPILEPAREGALAHYANLLIGEALLDLNQPQQAAVVLEGVDIGGDPGRRAVMLLGRSLIEAENYIDGRDTLRPLLTGALVERGVVASPLGADPAQVRWWLAEGARLRDSIAPAIAVYQRIWTHNPTSPFAVIAEERLAENDALADPQTSSGRALIESRILTLQRMNLHHEALVLHDTLPYNDSHSERHQRAAFAFKGRDYALAVNRYEQLETPRPTELFNHALALSRTGNYDGAATVYTRLFESNPQHPRADLASFKIGYLSYDAGDLTNAITFFSSHLQRYPQSAHADEALWFIGWSHFKLEQISDAQVVLSRLLTKYPRSSLAPAAQYWLARIDGINGQAHSETTGYETVIDLWPASGYAWFAARKLGRTWPAAATVATPQPTPTLHGETWEQGIALAQVGLDGWARQQLRMLIPTAQASGRDDRLALAHALIAAGDYASARSLAQPYCRPAWQASDPIAMQACYPRPHEPLVTGLTSDNGLDNNLPYAIMTAESALKPWVSSPAGHED